jgi:hypothetical protein
MKAMILAVFLIGAFAAGLFVMRIDAVSADGHERERQNQWQYQCFEAEQVAQVTERANKMGQQGWEMVTSAGKKSETLWCFKRPLWKPTN